MTLVNVGSTAHYSISYDDSLVGADGPDRANALLAVCEQDYAMMAGWFAGLSLTVGLPVSVNIVPGGYAGAGWGPPISLRPGNGSGLDVVRYLLVAEVVEMFMLAQGGGWFAPDDSNEGEAGEGLSRFLSTEFLVQSGLGHSMAFFDTAGIWLNSDRIDYINNVDVYDHAPDEKTGCATLFIYYLSYQLGYDIQHIIAAQAPTLAGVYRNLTGDAADPFPAFKQMLDAAFPRTAPDGTPITSVIPGPNPDNPYPLNQYEPEVPVVARVFWQMNPGRNVVNVNWDGVLGRLGGHGVGQRVQLQLPATAGQQRPALRRRRRRHRRQRHAARAAVRPQPRRDLCGRGRLVRAAHDLHGHRDHRRRPGGGRLPGAPDELSRARQRPRHPPHTGVPSPHEPAAHGDRQRGAHVQGIGGEDRRPHHRPPGHRLGLRKPRSAVALVL